MILLAIAAALLALAIALLAFSGRDVVIRVLALEEKRLRWHDQDAMLQKVREHGALIEAQRVEFTKRLDAQGGELVSIRQGLFKAR